jgi:hypothetical protein
MQSFYSVSVVINDFYAKAGSFGRSLAGILVPVHEGTLGQTSLCDSLRGRDFYSVQKMGLILRSIERIPKMQFSNSTR